MTNTNISTRDVNAELWWGDHLLASARSTAPCTLQSVLATESLRTLPTVLQSLEIRQTPDGKLQIGHNAVGWVSADDHNAVSFTFGEFRVCVQHVSERFQSPGWQIPAFPLAVTLASVLVFIGIVAIGRRATPLTSTQHTLDQLRNIAERQHRSAFIRPQIPQSPSPDEHASPSSPDEMLAFMQPQPTWGQYQTPSHIRLIDGTLPTSLSRETLQRWVDFVIPAASSFSAPRVFSAMVNNQNTPRGQWLNNWGLGPIGVGRWSGCEGCSLIGPGSARRYLRNFHAPVPEPELPRVVAHAPRMRPPAPEGGVLTAGYVQRTLTRLTSQDVQQCFRTRSEQVHLASGRVILQLVVKPDGSIQSPTIVSTTYSDTAFHQCVSRVVSQFAFTPSEQELRVRQTFWFTSEEDLQGTPTEENQPQ